MTSVREALDVVGQTVSIKELAHQRNASFPLSLREFVGALPPGRILKKNIPLALLQRKLDEFFNNLDRRPLFKIRLHNVGSGDHRHSTLDVFFDHPRTGYTSQMPDGQPRDLGQLESSGFDYHFSDVNSDGLTVTSIPGQPVGIEVTIHFETEDEEIKVDIIRNINFTKFSISIRLNLEFDRDNRLVDCRTEEKFIKPLISSNTCAKIHYLERASVVAVE